MLGPIRVLIVENSADDADLMLLKFRRSGLEPIAARVDTAEDLRKALASNPWDVVLSDYALPGFGAEAALRIVRETDPDLPFLVVSGTIGEDVAVRVMKAGASDFIPKQNLVRLPAAVEREIREAENRRARRQAERTVAHLGAIVRSSEDAIISETLDGLVTSWNPAAERLYGWTETEMIGRHISLIVPTDRTEELDEQMRRLMRGERIESYETVRVRKGGERIDVSVTLSLIRRTDGQPIGTSKITRDITERKQAAEALRRSEEQYRILAESIPQLVRMTEADGSVVFCNRRCLEYAGIRHEEASTSSWSQVIHPEDLPRCRERWMKTLRTGSAYEVEERLRGADGTYRWHLTRCLPLKDDRGRVVRWVATSTDIEERKRSDEAIRASEARFKALVEKSFDAVILTDANGTIRYASPPTERILGYAPEELVGRDGLDLIHPEDRPKLSKSWVRLIRFPDVTLTSILRTNDRGGDSRWLEARSTNLLDDPGLEAIVVNFRDITDRKRAEEKLARDALLLANVRDSVVVTDPEGRVNYWNEGAARLFGWTAWERIGRPYVDRFPESERDRIAEELRARFAGQEWIGEFQDWRKDGSRIWTDVRMTPLTDAYRMLVGTLILSHDITARRQLEEQYHQAQKMEAIGQLAGGIAHDFNNLLTIINGYASIIWEGLAADDVHRPMLGEVLKAVERSTDLTRKLLAFSRRQKVNLRPLDLNQVVGDEEKMLKRIIGEDIRFRTVLDPELGMVLADSGQVAQVLLNLAVNSRDAMPRGGCLTIETLNVDLVETESRLRVGAQAGPHVLLSVTDTGCGMTDEVKARIYEPFFSTKPPGKGTGLGLSVIHGIVKQAGGHIEVDSAPDVGTVFRIYLPRTDQAPEREAVAPDVRMPQTGSETILLVEDEAKVRGLARDFLRDRGYAVLEAADGAEALQIAEGYGGRIDLLVTDVVMPGIGGPDLTALLQAGHPALRVLFVSGYSDSTVLRHGINHDHVNFLPKPFKMTALARKVREVLDTANA